MKRLIVKLVVRLRQRVSFGRGAGRWLNEDVVASMDKWFKDKGTDWWGVDDEISGKLQTIDSTTEYLHTLIEQCIRWRIESATENGNDLVKKAKSYMDANYMNEDISLKTTAEYVGLSPTYLSALFKREMKRNFTEYLTEIRIRKAKELLCSTSKLICEIAYEVGFRDYRYFSQIFKKQTGMTPRQFQNSTNELYRTE